MVITVERHVFCTRVLMPCIHVPAGILAAESHLGMCTRRLLNPKDLPVPALIEFSFAPGFFFAAGGLDHRGGGGRYRVKCMLTPQSHFLLKGILVPNLFPD